MPPEPSHRPGVNFHLLGVTDRTLVREGGLDDWLAVLCWYGLRGVQLREKDLGEEALLELALLCRPIFNRHHLQWFVNGSVAVARRAESTGVHLAADQDVAAARAALGPDALIGQSAHGLDAARRAEAAGADFLVYGPVYATPSKAAYGPPRGLEELRAACAAVRIPVFAIGGITPERAEACRLAGARGAAAVSTLMTAEEPEETLSMYAHALERL